MLNNFNNNEIKFFKTNVKNSDLIDRADGMPIRGNHVGQIIINKKDRTVLIEIKQCTEPQAIAYFEGHLLCKEAEYETTPTSINGAVFILDRNKTNPDKYELQLNNNRQGIIIKCSEIELLDYRHINKPIKEYKDILVGLQYGKFFSIIENER
jgi:hypothetical protein